ncbi:MAG TPA: hypothetical protein VM221_12300 [Armatimonadota bacterium]|nr:hypothetical protein [Armatimonadota bacterium]
MAKQTKKQAVEQRTHLGGQAQQRPAARKEAAKKSAETRRAKFERQHPEVAEKKAALKKHEAKLVAETRKVLDAEAAAEAQPEQSQAAQPQAKRPERAVAQTGRAVSAMATVALRGEQAVRFRALAAARGVSLARLLVQMIEAFETQKE